MPDPQDLLMSLSEEEFETLKGTAYGLLKERDELNGACAALITSRRLYSIAMGALIDALDGQWNAELLRAFYLSATQKEAEKDFTGRELHAAVSGSTLPWLVDEILKVNMSSNCNDRPIIGGYSKEDEGDHDVRNNGKA